MILSVDFKPSLGSGSFYETKPFWENLIIIMILFILFIQYSVMLYFILNLVKVYLGVNTGVHLIRMGVECIIVGLRLLIS
jgi:hypothetical protein